MKSDDSLSTAAVLDLMGLQAKPTVSHRILTYAAFAVSGVLVGVAAGVLLAPKSGRAMRSDLRGSALELGDSIAAGATRAQDPMVAGTNASRGNASETGFGGAG